MLTPYIDGVYLVDFEFHPVNGVEGNPPEPVCMVVRNLVSGGVDRYTRSDLLAMKAAPFNI